MQAIHRIIKILDVGLKNNKTLRYALKKRHKGKYSRKYIDKYNSKYKVKSFNEVYKEVQNKYKR